MHMKARTNAKHMKATRSNSQKLIRAITPTNFIKLAQILSGDLLLSPNQYTKYQDQLKYFLRYLANEILFVWFGLNVAFNNLSVISRQCLDVTGSSMLTFRVLPHWNIMPQTLWHDIPPSHIILTLSWPVLIPSSTFLMLSAKQTSS